MHNEIKNILVASTNSGKVSEFSAMLDSDIISWRGLTEFKGLDEVVEDGETFVENARKKAVEYAEQTGLWTIADDSGLVVDALDGAPGVKSARFSGEKPPEGERQLLDEKNMQKVLELMKNVPTKKRTCRFKCFLCLASPGKVLAETEGTLEGFIAETQAGINGFGYDPIFFVPELGKTVAQLKQEQKNLISHRSKALAKMKSELDRLKKV
jgi:XTP/dITP diphosphohydrolase